MAEQEKGLRIAGTFYPFPPSLNIGETRMVKKLCGLTPSKFKEAIENIDVDDDPDVAFAVLWWVVHRQNPRVTEAELEGLEWDWIVAEGGDDEAGSEDPNAPKPGDSPNPGNGSEPSLQSVPESNEEAAAS